MPTYKAVEDIAVGDRLVEGAGGIAWLVTSTEATAKTVTLSLRPEHAGMLMAPPSPCTTRFRRGRRLAVLPVH